LLDRLTVERETPWVLVAGTSQKRLARVLNTAYANGLLSQDTFVRRTDQLLGGGVIDPVRLVGDLNFRPRRAPVAAALAGLLERAVHAFKPEGTPVYPLLALDWSGAQSEMLIGRHRGCDLVLSDLSVSRRHVRLVFRDGRWILQDLESTNGTIVNGRHVGRSELRPGDHVALGEAQLTID
jgi:hypothetical protein